MMNQDELSKIYEQNLVEDIIFYISTVKHIELRKAMDIYYSSKLSEQITDKAYGIENMDYKYLAEDLMDNESHLFT